MKSAFFKPDGCEYDYTVYENGEIIKNKTGYKIKQCCDKDGYYVCSFWCNGKTKRYRVHRVIMMAFHPIENPDDFVVNHIDGNVKNNNLENLEWTTISGNTKHAYNIGRINTSGEKNGMAKLTEKEVLEICELIKKEYSLEYISNLYNVKKSTISRIKNKKRWKNITNLYNFN